MIDIAEHLGAPIVKALLGKEVVPDNHPLTTGGLGLLGTTPSQDAMESATRILIIGSSFPYMEYLPKPDDARGVQIDDKTRPHRSAISGRCRPGRRRKADARGLIPLFERKEDRSFIETAQKGMKDWWELMEERAMSDAVRSSRSVSPGSCRS